MIYGILGVICAIAALIIIVAFNPPRPTDVSTTVTVNLIVLAALLLGIWAGGKRRDAG